MQLKYRCEKKSTHFGQAISHSIHLMCINLNGLSLVKCAKFERVEGKNPLIQQRIHKELTHENIFMNVHYTIYLNTH